MIAENPEAMNDINKGLRYGPYSYSKIDMHLQCPRRFKYKYVLKFPEGDSDKTALFKGIRIHNLLEYYPNNEQVKTDLEQSNIVNDFVSSDLGVKYLELETLKTAKREIQVKLSLEDGELLPQDNAKRKDLAFLGYIDYINVIEHQGERIINLVDWKSGKLKEQQYQDYNQLLFYQIYFFKKFSVDQVRISYCYVEHNLENDLLLKKEHLKSYEKTLVQAITNQENSNYKKVESKLCEWCPYQDVCSSDNS